MRNFRIILMLVLFVGFGLNTNSVLAQTENAEKVQILTDETHQTVVGFGASLAYYESWLTAHPKKNEIYEAIFSELSLDILRVRNAFGYDNGMLARVREFNNAAQSSLGKPISILSTSWGPPAYLKSNNDRKNGGTLIYSKNENGIQFDYSGFAEWWGKSLDAYEAYGVTPTYISIQNEPEFSADWESCILRPSEIITSTDTFAGYNKALDAVYEMVIQRENRPKILGPENVGIGYNSVENYINDLDVSKLDGIAHHLYHGVDENNPYITTNMTKVGNFNPEIPHFQTEYSRGDWFSLGGLMYKSFHDENVVAYLYWDLIWANAGLVSLDNPWNKAEWKDPLKGYEKRKEFYAFKQFSAFIHPGWKRVETSLNNSDGKELAFVNATQDSAAFVIVNKSDVNTLSLNLSIPGYSINESNIYITSETENCALTGSLLDSVFSVPPHSIVSVQMRISKKITNIQADTYTGLNETIQCFNYPNPFSDATTIRFFMEENETVQFSVFDGQGKKVRMQQPGYFLKGNNEFEFQRNGLKNGFYFYKLEYSKGGFAVGRFSISD